MPLKFNYRLPASQYFLALCVLPAFAFALAYVALDKSIVLQLKFTNRVLFNREEVALLCWAGVALIVVGMAMMSVMVARSLMPPQCLILSADSLVAPRASVRQQLMSIPFSSITNIAIQGSNEHSMMTIKSARVTARVMATGFETPAEFARFWKTLHQRVPEVWNIPRPSIARPAHTSPKVSDPQAKAPLNASQRKSKEDPSADARAVGKEVCALLLAAMRSEKGVHVESALCALGALAGYACQASVRASTMEAGGGRDAAFIVVKTKDGMKFFFGDALNRAVAEDRYSLWSLAAAAAQECGCGTLPDIQEIFGHSAETIGSEAFGVPRMPEGHRPADTPRNYLNAIWPNLLPTLKTLCPPVNWPLAFGLAAQELIRLGKHTIDPCIALKIVMESAIPMSKVDLDRAS